MNAKDINIGGVIFHIEENAYQILYDFIKGSNSFMEEKLAEIFLSVLSDSKQILNLQDVEFSVNSIQNKDSEQVLHSLSRKQATFRAYIMKLAHQQMGVSNSFFF